jgi:aldehyde dehydrogenase (NAD+)
MDHFIDGRTTVPQSGTYFDSIDPSNGAVYASVAAGNDHDVDAAVASAKAASAAWAAMRPLDRGAIVQKIGAALLEHTSALAQIETREMGMPSQASPGIIAASAEYFTYYGGLAPSVHGDTIPVDETTFAYTLYEPYGVVGIITPWNAPLNQAARSVAPALAAGNTVVVKPSEYTSVATVELARIAHAAGLPPGVFNVVTGTGPDVGEPLVRHPDVEKIAFTGSVQTGARIGAIAGERIVPVTLELGGKSPDIVFADAKPEVAVPQVLYGFVANSGQICTSGTRVIIERSIHDKFAEMLAEAAQRIPIGIDKPFPCLGPIANRMQYEKVLSYLDSARSEGARLVTGGGPARGEGLDGGFYIEPTIYTDVRPDMKIVREEIFGPVGVLIPFDTEEEAIAIANDTPYGLAAGVWSQDSSRVHRVAARLQAGTVYINTWHAQTIEVPMGGYKRSGVGRERGMGAIKAYMQTKNITQKLI